MATVLWQGGAPAVAQVRDYVFAGTWEATDIVDFTIGTRTVSVTVGSTTISTLLDTLVAAWNALSSTLYPEFAELTASKDGTTDFRLTADTAGKSFTVTLSTRDVGGAADAQTIDGGTSSTGVSITANSGPNDWSTAANWSGAAVPVNSDDVVIENSDVDILYGLDQNTVDLASLTIRQSFSGKIGLPLVNTDGGSEIGSGAYYEYRERYLKIGSTTVRIGEGDGAGSSFINWNGDSTATTVTVFNSGQSEDANRAAISILGTSTSNIIHVLKGSVDIGYEASATVGLATLNVGYRDNVAGDSTVRCGTGVSPLTAVNVRGGKLELNSNAVTIIQTDGEVTTNRAMTVTTYHCMGGALYDRSSGNVTTLYVAQGAVVDYRQHTVSKIVTTTYMYAGAALFDPFRRLTFTNSINLIACSLEDVQLDLGKNIIVTRTNL